MVVIGHSHTLIGQCENRSTKGGIFIAITTLSNIIAQYPLLARLPKSLDLQYYYLSHLFWNKREIIKKILKLIMMMSLDKNLAILNNTFVKIYFLLSLFKITKPPFHTVLSYILNIFTLIFYSKVGEKNRIDEIHLVQILIPVFHGLKLVL